VPYLRDVTQAHGHLHILEENQVEELGQSAFLLAARKSLFSVEADFSVNEHVAPYEASARRTRSDRRAQPRARRRAAAGEWARLEKVARKAIAAAAKFDNFVGGPITTVRTLEYSPTRRRWRARSSDAQMRGAADRRTDRR
jgi:hypothetical protein